MGEALSLLARAERPLIIAGSGVYYADGEEALRRFAAAAGAPIMIPIWDRGCVSEACEEFAGFLGAASGEPDLLGRADLLILAGARVDYRVGYLKPPVVREDARVIRISADADELGQGRLADAAILGDPASAFEQLLTGEIRSHDAWRKEAGEQAAAFRAKWRKVPAEIGGKLTGRGLVGALGGFITEETLFLIDGGDIGQWAHLILGERYPGHWMTCGASAVVGWGLPGAIAAKLRYPGKPVILLSGDGAAGFTLGEIETAVRYKTPFVMVIADDGGWGIVTAAQTQKYGRAISSALGPTRYDLLAEACGARGARAQDAEEVKAAVEEGLAADRPTVIQVPIAACSPTRAR